MSRFAWIAAVALALPQLAFAEDRDAEIFGEAESSEASRDDEIFGADSGGESEGAEAIPASSRDDEVFGEAPSDEPTRDERALDSEGLLSSGAIDAKLGAAENKLAIGGLLYLRTDYSNAEGQFAESSPIDSPNLLDLYLDARPNDRLRAFVRGRVTHRFGTSSTELFPGAEPPDETGVALDQLWLKWDIERVVYVTAGRQPIKWGAGRFWNPTDFLNVQTRDPLAVFDERLGVSLLKLHVPVEASGWNLYAIANAEDAGAIDQIGGAFRIEKLIDTAEISLSTAVRKDQPFRVGADVSLPVWLFDLRAEVALTHGDERQYYRGDYDIAAIADIPPALPEDATAEERSAYLAALADVGSRLRTPEAYSREDDWIPQAVLGAEVGIPYGDDDSLYVGAEYFYNGAGTDDPELYPWLLFNGRFEPLYVGRHYAGLYATAIGPGEWNDTTFIASVLGNLDDRSFLGRFDYRVRLLTYLDVNTYVGYHFGEPGEFRLALNVPKAGGPIPASAMEVAGLPQGAAALLEEGYGREAPRIELGAGLSLRF